MPGTGSTDWIDARIYPGADPTGVNDSTAAIQAALNDAGSSAMPRTVYLAAGTWLVSSPLQIPIGVHILGSASASAGAGTAVDDDYGTVLSIASYFGNPLGLSQPGVFYINGNGVVKYYRITIENLWIDGSNAVAVNGATGIHGISAYGGAFHCRVSGVGMRNIPQDGLHCQADGSSNRADGWLVNHCIIQSYGQNPSGTAYGVNWVGQDTCFLNVHVQQTGQATTGGACWYIQNGSNCRLIGCRGDQSGDCGFVIDSNPGGTSLTDSPGSSIALIGCGTENNYNYGLKVTNSSATGGQMRTPVLAVGCSWDFDGRGNAAGAGMRVEGTNIFEAVGCDVTTADNAYPQYGLVTGTIGTGSNPPLYVRAEGGFWNCQGATPVSDAAGFASLVDVDAVVNGPALASTPVSRYMQPTPPNTPQPSDVGYVGWTYDSAMLPNNPTGVALPNGGVLFCWKVPIRSAQSFSNVRTYLVTAGSGLTTGECFIGVISSAGALLATSADMTSAWEGATGILDAAMTAAAIATPPFVWIVALFNGTTGPSFARTNNASAALANGKLTAAVARYATILTAQTSLPSGGITPGNLNLTSDQYWGAIW